MTARHDSDATRRASTIQLLGLDVDGTLTDGRIVIGARGELAKFFSVHDGQGMRLLMDSGIHVAIITARKSKIVQTRAKELGIAHVMQGVRDKATALKGLAEQYGLSATQVAFMGDDLPDLPAMRFSGLSASVANGAEEVVAAAHWVSARNGGDGAVRQLCEFILKSQGLWEQATSRFTSADNN